MGTQSRHQQRINTLNPILALNPIPSATALRVSMFISTAEGAWFYSFSNVQQLISQA
jgi:hypothetical protein